MWSIYRGTLTRNWIPKIDFHHTMNRINWYSNDASNRERKRPNDVSVSFFTPYVQFMCVCVWCSENNENNCSHKDEEVEEEEETGYVWSELHIVRHRERERAIIYKEYDDNEREGRTNNLIDTMPKIDWEFHLKFHFTLYFRLIARLTNTHTYTRSLVRSFARLRTHPIDNCPLVCSKFPELIFTNGREDAIL